MSNTPSRVTRSGKNVRTDATAPDGDTPMFETPTKDGNGDDDFADLFNELAITEEEDENLELQQILARHYVTWAAGKDGFNKTQSERASTLMKKTKEKTGSKGIDYDGTIKKWFFTNKMWEAKSTQQFMVKHDWNAYTLTEDDKKFLKKALSDGKIKNLDVK